MKIILFAKIFALLTAGAMIAFVLTPDSDLLTAAKYEAVAIAISLIVPFVHPYFSGIQPGEKVLLVMRDPLTSKTIIQIATAVEGAKLHGNVKINMGKGRVAEAKVESYAGIFTPARVSLKPENAVKVI